MGNAISTKTINDLSENVFIESPDVVFSSAIKVGDKSFIIIGEDHDFENLYESYDYFEKSLLSFSEKCRKNDILKDQFVDIFVEYPHMDRFEFVQNLRGGDRIDRVSGLVPELRQACKKMRFHAVDIRLKIFQNTLLQIMEGKHATPIRSFVNIVEDFPHFFDSVINMSKKSDTISNSKLVFAYKEISVDFNEATELLNMQDLSEDSSLTPVLSDYLANAARDLFLLCSRVMDVYAARRMISRQNSKLIISYTGVAHAANIARLLCSESIGGKVQLTLQEKLYEDMVSTSLKTSRNTILDPLYIRTNSTKQRTKLSIRGIDQTGRPFEVRESVKTPKFRIQKDVHDYLVKNKGYYILKRGKGVLKIDADEVTKLLEKGNWNKDRDYPYKFLHLKDVMATGMARRRS